MRGAIAAKNRVARFLLAAAATATVNALLVVALAALNRVPDAEREEAAEAPVTVRVDRPVPEREEEVPKAETQPKERRQRFTVDLDRPTADRPSPGPVQTDVDLASPTVGEIAVAVSEGSSGSTEAAEQQRGPSRGDRVDRPPRELHTPAPEYPRAARRRRREGSVTVKLLIDRAGDVRRVRTQRVDGPASFAEAVREAVASWQFRPAEHRGRKVRVWAVKTIRFKISRR